MTGPAAVLDGFLDPGLYVRAEAQAPSLPYRRKESPQYRVWAHDGAAPGGAAAELDRLFASPGFLRRVAPGLRLEPAGREWLRFDDGDLLGEHDDRSAGRRLQAVLYLVPDWSEARGGLLELLDASGRPAGPPIVPRANRLVVFETATTRHRVTPVRGGLPRFCLSASYR